MLIDDDARTRSDGRIAMAAELAHRGYGRHVIAMALVRQGADVAHAQDVAAATLEAQEFLASLALPPSTQTRQPPAIGSQFDRTGRAANLAINKMVSWLLYLGVGLLGGALLGWQIGFWDGLEQGVEQGLTQILWHFQASGRYY